MRRLSVMRMRFACLAVLLAAAILGCKDDRFVPMESPSLTAKAEGVVQREDSGAEEDVAKPQAAAQPASASTVADQLSVAPNEPSDAEPHVAAKPIVAEYAAGVPPVLLTAGHAALCKTKVGDAFPAVELPQLGGAATKVEQLAGKKATIVICWSPDRWMGRAALGDLSKDITPRELAGGVAIVGIAVGQPADAVQAATTKADAKFPQLLDAEGQTFALLGEGGLPRLFVLDADRRIAWFDIEYSEATRRELRQTLSALTGKK